MFFTVILLNYALITVSDFRWRKHDFSTHRRNSHTLSLQEENRQVIHTIPLECIFNLQIMLHQFIKFLSLFFREIPNYITIIIVSLFKDSLTTQLTYHRQVVQQHLDKPSHCASATCGRVKSLAVTLDFIFKICAPSASDNMTWWLSVSSSI